LDTNKDRVISAEELKKAPTALLVLDRNKDGQLTEDEYRPGGGPSGGPGGEPRNGVKENRPGEDWPKLPESAAHRMFIANTNTALAEWHSKIREAEPRRKCIPRQEPGNERIRGGDQRKVEVYFVRSRLFQLRK